MKYIAIALSLLIQSHLTFSHSFVVKLKKEYSSYQEIPPNTYKGHEYYNQLFGILHEYEVTEAYRPLKSKKFENIYILKIEDNRPFDSLKSLLSSLDIFEKIEPYSYYRYDNISEIPNDTFYSIHQWYLPHIGAEEVWNANISAKNEIKIAIIDQSFDINHVDLVENIYTNEQETINGMDDDENGYIDDINGWDAADSDNDVFFSNSHFHGTFVAGFAGAINNNGIGISALSQGVEIIPIKVSPNSNQDSIGIENMMKALEYAMIMNVDVISMSFSTNNRNEILHDLIKEIYSEGITMVASSSNQPTTKKRYPAAWDEVIAVTASDENDLKTSFAGYGNYIDIVAPGIDMFSLVPGNAYGTADGTSFSTPLVASICAQIKSVNPSLSPEDIIEIITSTAIPMNDDSLFLNGQLGAGRIDAFKAIEMTSIYTSSPLIEQKQPSLISLNFIESNVVISTPKSLSRAVILITNVNGQIIQKVELDSVKQGTTIVGINQHKLKNQMILVTLISDSNIPVTRKFF